MTRWLWLGVALSVGCGSGENQDRDDEDEPDSEELSEPAWTLLGPFGSCYYGGESLDDAALCSGWGYGDVEDADDAAARCEADDLILGPGIWSESACTFAYVPMWCEGQDDEPFMVFRGARPVPPHIDITQACEDAELICAIYGGTLGHDGMCPW